MKTKTVYRKSIFPADIDRVYRLLKKLKMLNFIARPYASFTPIGGDSDIRWEKGQRAAFRLRLFCVVPFGVHTINVISFSKQGICTHESNTYVPVWNHRIRLRSLPDGRTEYSDEVEIGAGWKTIFVWLWARCFYAHRQRKWIRYLSKARSEKVTAMDNKRSKKRNDLRYRGQ